MARTHDRRRFALDEVTERFTVAGEDGIHDRALRAFTVGPVVVDGRRIARLRDADDRSASGSAGSARPHDAGGRADPSVGGLAGHVNGRRELEGQSSPPPWPLLSSSPPPPWPLSSSPWPLSSPPPVAAVAAVVIRGVGRVVVAICRGRCCRRGRRTARPSRSARRSARFRRFPRLGGLGRLGRFVGLGGLVRLCRLGRLGCLGRLGRFGRLGRLGGLGRLSGFRRLGRLVRLGDLAPAPSLPREPIRPSAANAAPRQGTGSSPPRPRREPVHIGAHLVVSRSADPDRLLLP